MSDGLYSNLEEDQGLRSPWLMVALVVTAERAVEPLIPAKIWLALYGVVEAARLVWSPLRRRLWPRAQPTAS